MIVTKTPLRVSFFGGGTDFKEYFEKEGGIVLSTSIDKYTYVTVRDLPDLFSFKNELTYSKTERVENIDEIEHPLIRNAMKFTNTDKIRLFYDADLPAGSGLASSSSFAVGLLNAFKKRNGEVLSNREMSDQSIHLERVMCAESGGIQDQIAVAFGGLNKIEFSKDGYTVNPIECSAERKAQLNNKLMLFYTGITRRSFEIQDDTRKSITDSRKSESMSRMKEIAYSAINVLEDESRNLVEFGELLDETWRIKHSLSSKISNNQIDKYYDMAMKAGAVGGKLLGAGGGGFLLFYVDEKEQESVINALSELHHVKFSFEDTGGTIIYEEK
ncbi:kinase [Erysipelothrix anatis]|uniref:GHMP family kinase ATP-binding protein n=1 Tax=Erysipelothrix anatis TaxID=2683713 RepID=UPI001357F3A6|nr:kinase [Erysipelothrix anatis]